jgi:FKBP-type peptidyl-prolyl cis-trans isomerase FkpA
MTHLFSSSSLLRLTALALAAVPFLASCKKDEIDYDAIAREQQAQLRAAFVADSLTITKYIADSSFKKVERRASGVYIVTKKEGTGDLAKPGQTLTTYYKGYTIPNNKLFDATKVNSSTGVIDPYFFTLNVTNVIAGWHEGFASMRKGQKAILLIPSALGYGSTGAGSGAIPPNTPLRFDVELADIK